MKNLTANFIVACIVSLIGHTAFSQITFNYTGTVQTYVVPAGVTSIQIETYGAAGGNNGIGIGTGGLGGYTIGEFPVTPGETLNIYVGGEGDANGTGGFNGGGTGISSPGGGGASDVRQGGTTFNDRIIVAGGGGGAAYETAWSSGWAVGNGAADGGAGGGLVGVQGMTWQTACQGGTGGTQSAGGAMGGTFGIGGDGSTLYGDTGGGGGGYYGGGGGGDCTGYNGAGGGGSGYAIPTATNVSYSTGIQSGNGLVVITLLCTPLTTSVSSTDVCDGELVTLSATGSGNITWDNGITDNVAFQPTLGTTTYTATSDDITECAFSVDITVNGLPTVNGGQDIELCDIGLDTTLTGSGTADTYSWDNSIVDGVPFTPALGVTQYIVTGEIIATGCTYTDTVSVVINPLPSVDAGADFEDCDGNSITLSGAGTGDVYTWDNGVQDGVPFTAVEGNYTYVVTGIIASTGCASTDTVNLTVNASPAITLTSYDELYGNDGSVVLVIDEGTAPFTFDWDNDGTGDHDDVQSPTTLTSGNYTVVMTDASGCTATESIFVGSQVGITELENGIAIYPNPTSDVISIEKNGTFEYILFNAAGQIVQTGEGNNSTTIDVSSYEAGDYLIKVVSTTGVYRTNIIKF
jgi:hypothetical protein